MSRLLTDLEIELNALNELMEQPQIIIDEKNGIYQKVDLKDSIYYQIGRVLKAYENQQSK